MWVRLSMKLGFWPCSSSDAHLEHPPVSPAADSHTAQCTSCWLWACTVCENSWSHRSCPKPEAGHSQGVCWGSGPQDILPMHIPASAGTAREISHLQITRRHKCFADSIGSHCLKSVGLPTWLNLHAGNVLILCTVFT